MTSAAELLKRKLHDARAEKVERDRQLADAAAELREVIKLVRATLHELASVGSLPLDLQVYIGDDAYALVLSGNAVHIFASYDDGPAVTLFQLWRGAHDLWRYAAADGIPSVDKFAAAHVATAAALVNEEVVEQIAAALTRLT